MIPLSATRILSMLPKWRAKQQWLFSVKVFGAAMLSLYIALALGLDHPYWAMATVYLVSNPLDGATRSKSAYRIGGTVLGASINSFGLDIGDRGFSDFWSSQPGLVEVFFDDAEVLPLRSA